MAITLTEKAAQRVEKYLESRGKGVGLKLAVKTTGCSGMAYVLEFADEIRDSVFRRMESERKAIASERRSEGAAEAEKIRANADRQRVGLLAQAYKEAQDIKGVGDAKAASAYADAFGEDPEFAEFYRSLKAYRESFKSGSDLIITDPNSDFFQFFKSNKGGN